MKDEFTNNGFSDARSRGFSRSASTNKAMSDSMLALLDDAEHIGSSDTLNFCPE